ncbi:MAG: hypothetical protein NTW08_03000 [Gammaproteobacteria bacterium]|nr:hypothetical protein [Gammaproteobacteria bacterium]
MSLPHCPDCYPETPNHAQDKLNSILQAYISRPFSWINSLLLLKRSFYLTDRYLVLTIRFLKKINKIQMHDTLPSTMVNRIQLLWNEAKQRGLTLYSFSLEGCTLLSFLLIYKGKNHYFHYSPTSLLHKQVKAFKDPAIYDDKQRFKKILSQHQLPYPEGRLFFSKQQALYYGKKLGFPLVVKPAASSLTHHVTLKIETVTALRKAIDVAKKVDCRLIVERYIPGDVHRMMVVGDQFLACAKRTRPFIVGDGVATVEKLIDAFNRNPLRGEVKQAGFALYQIKKEAPLIHYLATQALELSTRLDKGKTVYLTQKTTCSNGAEVMNVTDSVCQENIALFEKIHLALGIAVSAIDFICLDVSRPWHTQPFAFLENNSFPDIGFLHCPSSGEPVNLSKSIWDLVLSHLE